MATFVTMSVETSLLHGEGTQLRGQSRTGNERAATVFLFNNPGRECKRFKLESCLFSSPQWGRFSGRKYLSALSAPRSG